VAERKQIPKSVRFDVFKRDGFTCQYCGKMAPDVILEIDHIKPVSDAGDNNILNLVTSCRDCNRGKGSRTLSDNSAIKKQQKTLAEMHERKEQLTMMLEWKKEMSLLTESQVDALQELISNEYNSHFTDSGRKGIKLLISRFGFLEVYSALETATLQYSDCEEALRKLGGICFNRKIKREEEDG